MHEQTWWNCCEGLRRSFPVYVAPLSPPPALWNILNKTHAMEMQPTLPSAWKAFLSIRLVRRQRECHAAFQRYEYFRYLRNMSIIRFCIWLPGWSIPRKFNFASCRCFRPWKPLIGYSHSNPHIQTNLQHVWDYSEKGKYLKVNGHSFAAS